MQTWDTPLQIKQLSAGGEIVGLAAAFGNVDSHGDRIAAGAFATSLAAHETRGTRPAMLLHHDMARPIGRWEAFEETGEGLVARGKLSLGARDGAEAYALASDGALTGLSIGFRLPKDGATIDRRDGVRELRAIELLEVSLVAVPSNERTRVQSIKAIASVRDIEDVLSEAGLSNRQAKAAAGAAWKAINTTSDDDRAAVAAIEAAIARLQKGN